MKTIFTIAEAAEFISQKSEFTLTEDDVIDLTQQELLPICFAAEGELLQARIEHEGQSKDFIGPIPFNGILRAMSPPDSGRNLTATLVEIVRVDCMRFARREGKKFGLQFPTEDAHGGRIKVGHRVIAYVDFVDVTHEQWRFHISDLLHIRETQELAETSTQLNTDDNKRGIGVPYKEIIEGFGLDESKWKEKLRKKERHKLYEAARCAPGAQKPGASATFNPAIFGSLLIKNKEGQHSITKVDAIIKNHFMSYLDEWEAERQDLE